MNCCELPAPAADFLLDDKHNHANVADLMEQDEETLPAATAAMAIAGPSSSRPSSTASGDLNNAQKDRLYQVLRALFLDRGVSSVILAEVVQAYNDKSRQQSSAEAVDKVSMFCFA